MAFRHRSRRLAQNDRMRTTYPSGIVVRDCGEHTGVPVLVIARRVRVPARPHGIVATTDGDGVIAASFHCHHCWTAVVTHRSGYVAFPSDDGGGGGGGDALLASTVAVAAAHDSAATPVSMARASRCTVLQATATDSMRNCITVFTQNCVNTAGHIRSTLTIPLNMASRVQPSRTCNRASTTVRHRGATLWRGLETNVLSASVADR